MSKMLKMSLQNGSSRLCSILGMVGLCAAFGSAGFGQRGSTPPLLPDKTMTPGDTLDVTSADVCKPGYSKSVRDVPSAVKKQVYDNYKIASHKPGEYEVDHLISLELGGSNSIRNLWPESYVTQPWNAHVKDKLENELHRLVCANKIDLKTAQRDIASDWIAAYKKYFHTDKPLSAGHTAQKGASSAASDSGTTGQSSAHSSGGTSTSKGQVWVNTDSGLYFQPGTRYYGKTKAGKYMTEAEAIRQDYKPAK